jgi:hypothetical protein
MLRTKSRQNGMTGLGWLTVLLLIGFFAMLTFKIAPSYLENYSVKTVLKSLEEEPLITQQSKKEIRSMISSRLITNGVRDIKHDMIKINKKPGLLNVTIDYFVRKPMVGNIDVVMTFKEEIELVSN